MISPRKLIKMARKWQKSVADRQKRLTLTRSTGTAGDSCTKGHFVVYTADERRFEIPLSYLKHEVFRELLKMAEEEYGLPSNGPIRVPCDAVIMEYAISLIQKNAAKALEKALLKSMNCGHFLSTTYNQEAQINQQLLICSF